MLSKHPDHYSDEELEAWVRHLVDEKVSEGPRLDYKEAISLDSDKQRLEAAKDISSFANELGGTVIYGIPEDRQSDETAIPRRPYGIEPVPDFESRLENIYADSIVPRLPEWRIRKIALTEYEGKVVYIVWAPESWLGPHMVQAYKDQRYYRRGQLRAVPMAEHEVRTRYERKRNLETAVEDFIKSPEISYVREYIGSAFVRHYLTCPMLLTAGRVDFITDDMRKWLRENVYGEQWAPSAYGVRAGLQSESDNLQITEMHRNGAISDWVKEDISDVQGGKYPLAYLHELQQFGEFLKFASRFYEKILYTGPLLITLSIFIGPGHMSLPRRNLFIGEDPKLFTHDHNLNLRVVEPSNKLFGEPNLILKRMADELFRAFGRWEAHCFDENLNLKER